MNSLKFLKDSGIFVKKEWIKECVIFIKYELGDKIDMKVLEEKIIEQFLNSDLQEIGMKSIEDNIKNNPETAISSVFESPL